MNRERESLRERVVFKTWSVYETAIIIVEKVLCNKTLLYGTKWNLCYVYCSVQFGSCSVQTHTLKHKSGLGISRKNTNLPYIVLCCKCEVTTDIY